MRRIILMGALVVVAAMGCGTNSDSGGSDGQGRESITLQPGERTTIRLGANATTPYRWVIVTPPDPGVAKVVSEDYEPDSNPEGRLGVGGTQRYVVEGVGKGTTTLAVEYQRVEGGYAVESERYEITVR